MASAEFEQDGQTYNQQLRAMQSKSQTGAGAGASGRADRYTRSFLDQNPKGLELIRVRAGSLPASPIGQEAADLSPAEVLKVFARMRSTITPDVLGTMDALAAGLLNN